VLIDRNSKHHCQVLTEEKLDEIAGAQLQQSPHLFKWLAQEMAVLKGSIKTGKKLILQPYKIIMLSL
jgi:hypothetical protein